MSAKWQRHSDWVTRSRRWPALRLQVLRRDGWRCVQCGAAGRLEVDHVEPVRTHPERAFDPANLQSLCPSCHTHKTRRELGQPEMSKERQAWRDLVNGEKQQCLNP